MNCDNCNAKCCNDVMFQLFNKDHVKWAKLHGLRIKTVRNSNWACFDIPCTKLKSNKCSIYSKRPQMCKEYYCEQYE